MQKSLKTTLIFHFYFFFTTGKAIEKNIPIVIFLWMDKKKPSNPDLHSYRIPAGPKTTFYLGDAPDSAISLVILML